MTGNTRLTACSESSLLKMELKAEMNDMEMRLSDKMNDLFRWAVATNLAVTGLLMAAMTAALKFL